MRPPCGKRCAARRCRAPRSSRPIRSGVPRALLAIVLLAGAVAGAYRYLPQWLPAADLGPAGTGHRRTEQPGRHRRGQRARQAAGRSHPARAAPHERWTRAARPPGAGRTSRPRRPPPQKRPGRAMTASVASAAQHVAAGAGSSSTTSSRRLPPRSRPSWRPAIARSPTGSARWRCRPTSSRCASHLRMSVRSPARRGRASSGQRRRCPRHAGTGGDGNRAGCARTPRAATPTGTRRMPPSVRTVTPRPPARDSRRSVPGRLDEARTAFERARAARPNGAEAADGLKRVDAAHAGARLRRTAHTGGGCRGR